MEKTEGKHQILILIKAKIKHIHLNKGLLFETEFQHET